MPELPDVEATRLYLLSEGLVGRTITGVTLLWPRAVQSPSEEAFAQGVSGGRIREIGRRAKLLLFRLQGARPSPDSTLAIHLRMTGSLTVKDSGQEWPKHTRNVFHLDDGRSLCFADPRKLGKLRLVLDEAELLAGLGPEPLEAGFTAEVLAQRLSRRGTPVKALLCDQSVVAGIGNIYADEALFLAGVHPLKLGRDLSATEVPKIHSAIIRILPEAIRRLSRIAPAGGPPTESKDGLKLLRVPRVEGTPCSRCRTPTRRVIIQGRSAYFCPRCQPE